VSCSKEYMSLVVTSGGQTPSNQTGFYPTPFDYDEWLALARRLGLRLFVHLNRLESVSKAPEDVARYQELAAEAQALRDQYDALPSVWSCCFLEMQTLRNVGDAAALAVSTVCLMEQVDNATEALGSSPPAEKGAFEPAVEPETKLAGVGLVLALGLGAYVAYKVSQ